MIMTNLDWIRSLDAKQLTVLLFDISRCDNPCFVCVYPYECGDAICREGVEEWLNKERK